MPALVPVLVGWAAGAAAGAVLGSAFAGTLVGKLIVGGVSALASGLASQAMAGDGGGDSPAQSFEQQARGALINSANTVDPIPVIYGQRTVGGTRVLTEVSGASNEYLHIVLVLCEGQIASIRNVYLDDVNTTDARFSGLVTVEKYLGTDTQIASAALIADLPAKWTVNHRLAGVAYVYLRLRWDQNAFPNGLPTITADVDGKLVADPRDGLTKFSHNPALCIREYLTNARYGRTIPASSIDDTLLQVAANHAEERIDVPARSLTFTADAATDLLSGVDMLFGTGHGVEVSSTGSLPTGLSAATTYYVIRNDINTVKLAASYADALAGTAIDLTSAGSGTLTIEHIDMPRYTCDGIINIDDGTLTNLQALLSSCRGMLVFSGGKYKLINDKAETPLAFTFNEDNIVGGWQISLGSKRTKFNRVTAKFFNPANRWQPDLAVYDSEADRDDDNDILLQQNITLNFTSHTYGAQIIAQMMQKQSRFPALVQFRATIAGMQCEVGDVVPLTHTTPGWVAKNFRVLRIELMANDEVQITATEYDSSVYSLDPLALPDFHTVSTLPNVSTPGAPGTPSVVESLYQTTGSAGVKSRARVSWSAAADAFVQAGGRYQIEYQLHSASSWSIGALVQASLTSVDIFDLAAGNYHFRVRAINSLGASTTSPSTTQELFGLNSPPSDLTNFAVQSYAGQAKFTWDKPTSSADLDVVIGGRVFVRWSPLTTGASWEHGSLVNPDGYPGDTSIGMGPLMSGTYLAKARDSSGNFSVNASSFVVTEALIAGLSTIATLTESPTFAGTKSNVAAIDGGIQLDSVTLIDSMVTLMDSWGSIDSLGGVNATGSYAFASKLDLTTVQPARLCSTIASLAFDVDDLWDSRTDPIDDWGLVDGAVIEDAEVQLMVRTTNDDPNASPTWGPWHALGLVGDYNARGFDFRLDFASGNATHNRTVTTLSVVAKN